jgi:hypothetical protein
MIFPWSLRFRIPAIPKGETASMSNKTILLFGGRPSIDGKRYDNRSIHFSSPINMLRNHTRLCQSVHPVESHFFGILDTCLFLHTLSKACSPGAGVYRVMNVMSRLQDLELLLEDGLLHECCCRYHSKKRELQVSNKGSKTCASGMLGLAVGTPPSMTSR